MSDREKYPDGRLVPIAGDEVYQAVRGPFGSAAYIYGTVYASRGKLRVKVTGSQSMLGGYGGGKTCQLSPHWTVKSDPELQRRRDAAEAKRLADEQAAKESKERSESIQREWDSRYGRTDPRILRRGDVVACLSYCPESLDDETQYVIGAFAEASPWSQKNGFDRIEVYGWPLDCIDGSPGYMAGRFRLVKAGGRDRDSLPPLCEDGTTADPPAELAGLPC